MTGIEILVKEKIKKKSTDWIPRSFTKYLGSLRSTEYAQHEEEEGVEQKLKNLAGNLRSVNTKYKELYTGLYHLLACYAESAETKRGETKKENSYSNDPSKKEKLVPAVLLEALKKKEEKINRKKVVSLHKPLNAITKQKDDSIDQDELKKEEIVKLINEISIDFKETLESKIAKELKSLANEEEATNNIFKSIGEILNKVSKKLT
jgi:hypothetical protein